MVKDILRVHVKKYIKKYLACMYLILPAICARIVTYIYSLGLSLLYAST